MIYAIIAEIKPVLEVMVQSENKTDDVCVSELLHPLHDLYEISNLKQEIKRSVCKLLVCYHASLAMYGRD